MKDNILDRTQAFNVTQLVDFILTRYESYTSQRLLDFCNGRYNSALLKNVLPLTNGLTAENVSNTAEPGLFTVQSQSSEDVSYTVDIARGFCSCFVGNSGRLCKHASAVLLKLDMTLGTGFRVVNEATRSLLFHVAVGMQAPSDWLLPLHAVPDVSFQDVDVQQESQNVTDTAGAATAHVHRRDDHSASSSADVEVTADDCATSAIPALSDEEKAQLGDLLVTLSSRIQSGLLSNPNSFVPAVRKFMTSCSHYAATDTGLLTLLTTFGQLPVRKRKAPHSLQECVYRGSGLGSTKHTK